MCDSTSLLLGSSGGSGGETRLGDLSLSAGLTESARLSKTSVTDGPVGLESLGLIGDGLVLNSGGSSLSEGKGSGLDNLEGGGIRDLKGGLSLLSLAELSLAGPDDELSLVLLQSEDVGSEALLRAVAASAIESDTDRASIVDGESGSLSRRKEKKCLEREEGFCGVGIVSWFLFCLEKRIGKGLPRGGKVGPSKRREGEEQTLISS